MMKMKKIKSLYIRTGFGYDIHRLIKGPRLIIGGVEIPSTKGLLGHSDADVLLHAICDALLGAASLGDIGIHFPNTDIKYKGISSLVLLEKVAQFLKKDKYVVLNIDATVVLQSPKLSKYIDLMREKISFTLDISKDNISIKATTNEYLGDVGKGKGCAAYAVATITKR